MKHGTELLANDQQKVLLYGKPKGGGKSTLAMTAPGNKLIFQYDLGGVTVPPGVNPATVWVQDYPQVAPKIDAAADEWERPIKIGAQIMTDLEALQACFIAGGSTLTFVDGGTCPLPDTVILDGLVALADHVTNWIMGIHHLTDAEAMPGGSFALWRRRLHVLNTLFNLVLSLPCRVILITWEQAEMRTVKDGKGRPQQEATGRVLPDIGGKLNVWGPGKVDACLYCYSQRDPQGLRYHVRTKPSELILYLGVRGQYTLPETIDVTLSSKQVDPWLRIWPPFFTKEP